ncbi:hypothetical protein AQUCO_01300148v1 [Aquilegia coerulea]|uniref:G-patch domain-containing protein n=1 Tax=Aquilegia coerulea TaxID=218851 RepID=A0A2G5E041_AQUCA|nr:hypothetical protein AQUCO_01300148v1 [Aquilegia coerulea]
MEKLSFSLNPNPSSTQKPKSPDNFIDHQVVVEEEEEDNSQKTTSSNTEFITEFNSSETLNSTQQQPKLIIPPLPNTWKPYNKILESNFESFNTSTNSTTSYGGDDKESNTATDLSMELKLLRKFREDVKRLPDDKGLDEFRDVPIEGFGKALLSGYGWYEGKGIGKNVKEDVKLVQYQGRIARAGLGFVSQNDSTPTTNTD